METFRRRTGVYWHLLFMLVLVNTHLFVNMRLQANQLYIFAGVSNSIFLGAVVFNYVKRTLVSVQGNELRVNTLFKSHTFQISDLKGVYQRSRNFVFFEKNDGTRIDLHIRDFDKATRKRFLERFNVTDY